MYDMCSSGGVLYHPPHYEGDSQPPKYGFTTHIASTGRPESFYSPENQC
jgi:hypothetical protein